MLIDFIKQKWGWVAVLAIAGDYSNFEKILGVSKEEFNKQFVAFVVQKYSSK